MVAGPPTGATVPDAGDRRHPNELDDRLGALAELLDRRGVPFDRVGSAGEHHEIAVIAAGPDVFSTLSGLAPQVRELGFRFVALDLHTVTDRIGDPDQEVDAEPEVR